MSACNFNIAFTGTPLELTSKAKKGITGAGGTFDGDAFNGVFEMPTPVGAIKGKYSIVTSVIEIIITDKPFFISCKRIQEELQKQLQA